MHIDRNIANLCGDVQLQATPNWRRKTPNEKTEDFSQGACIGKYNVNPYYYSLIKLDWVIFGGISWDNEHYTKWTTSANELRKRDFGHFLWQTCLYLNLRQDSIGYYFKSEMSGEAHAHFIIAKKNTEKTTPIILASTMQEIWTKGLKWKNWEQRSRGLAIIKPFDNNLLHDGLSYICKVQFDSNGQELEPCDILSPKLTKQIVQLNGREIDDLTGCKIYI